MSISSKQLEGNFMSRIRPNILSVFVVLLALTVAAPAFAGDVNSRAGTSAFPFLKIPVGARAVAMGGAFTGLANDESSLYYNPAGIVGLGQHRYILGYHNYFVDMQSGFAGYIREVKRDYYLAGYASYLNFGEFIEADEFGQVTGDFSGGDLLLAVTGAMQYNHSFAFGATMKFIYESLHDYSSTGFAIDLGAKYSSDRKRYNAGFAIQNIGKQLSALGEEKYRLPLTFRGGGAVVPKGLPMTISADLIIPVDNDPVFALGGEYFEFKPVYLRMGWNSFGSNYRADDSDDKWAGLSFGVGFDIKKMQISYVFSPGAELGESNRITLNGSF